MNLLKERILKEKAVKSGNIAKRMTIKKIFQMSFFVCAFMFLFSCGAELENIENQESEIESTEVEEILLYEEVCDLETPAYTEGEGTFQRISPQKAKEMMESDETIIILDVREQEEFDSGHIKDAILIPLNQIFDLAPLEIPDKEIPILVYCRSGRRSLEAAEKLVQLGYIRVYEFGGILDWPYEVVQ